MSVALLQLKITLIGVKPPIWRRVLVPNTISLRRLHELFQAVAGWKDGHQHEFVVADRRYGKPSPREVVPVHDEALVRLHGLPLAKGTSFTYVYDFRDRWEIEVRVERTLPPDPGVTYSFVLDGTRAFPPEGCAGALGYQRLLQALFDPSDPEHAESQQRVGDDFDPEWFDPEASNRRVRELMADQSRGGRH